MRVMVMLKATRSSEAGRMPDEALQVAMGRFNQELARAGILLGGDDLQPSSQGKRVRLSGRKRVLIDGPFAQTEALVVTYWVWQVKSMQEALEWVRRCPDPISGEDAEVEIRPVFHGEDCVKFPAPCSRV